MPLGVFRTWVKNVEVGRFPDARRHFAVMRCNHCAEPPCVDICPTNAMHQRPDGIVDIAQDLCIGCKACMQACPYDAVYMDPEEDTAAKCHFCAHRVDQGLLPACVVVCPTESLVFGDMDDPESRVSRVLGTTPVSVRRPDQGTRPKAFYVGAHEATLNPLAARHDNRYMWAERPEGTATDNATQAETFVPDPRPAAPDARSLDARVAYDVSHPITWRSKVSGYLWTKSLAAGIAFIAALPGALGAPTGPLFNRIAPILSLTFLALTGILLISDLKRPERFWFILLKPHWKSWLTKGAYVITLFGFLLTLWAGAGILGQVPKAAFAAVIAVAALATAVYTAFLFAQCEARDLWQSPILGLQLVFQMGIAGAAGLLLAGALIPHRVAEAGYLTSALMWALIGQLAATWLGELMTRQGSPNARAASRVMTHGRYAAWYWFGVLGGCVIPLTIVLTGNPHGEAIAAVFALSGLFATEHAFVMAGQAVPIS